MSETGRVGKWDYDKKSFIANQIPDPEVREAAYEYSQIPWDGGGLITLDECIEEA